MKRSHRPVESFWFTPKSEAELPVDEQTSFLCRPLTQAERMAVYDDVEISVTDGRTGDVVSRSQSFQQARELFLSHVEEIRNFPAGEALAWPPGKSAREKYLEMLPDIAVFEVGNEIRERSAMDTTAKNS